MNKFFVVILMILVNPLSVSAATFKATTEVTKYTEDLSLIETSAFILPPLIVDKSVKQGDKCLLWTGYINYEDRNQLCRGAGPESKKGSRFTLSGAAFASVDISIANEVVLNGLRLTTYGQDFTPSYNFMLNESGEVNFYVTGEIELIDIEQVASGTVTFDYEVTASYK